MDGDWSDGDDEPLAQLKSTLPENGKRVCVCVCVCVCVHACECSVCLRARTHMRMYVCACVCVHTCECSVCVCVCVVRVPAVYLSVGGKG